ncbi:MAG TPA: SMC-Scp complex subunit ScpB [Verrucomicrobiales bacterium]|nr:SMC-Scp complex subunit ScpB [Verrucomicrobiales bacterium]
MELKLILESILFSAQKPLSLAELRSCMKEAPEHVEEALPKELAAPKVSAMEEALALLQQDYDSLGRSYRLACVAGSWQFVSIPEVAPWVKALVGHRPRPPRLSQAALETLAIIAYRQPLTRAEGEQIRGVAIDGVLKMLLERGLVEQAGRAEVLGRPMTFRTTELFLEYFGLKDLDDLPAADELRRIPVETPPPLTSEDEESPAEPELSLTATDDEPIPHQGEAQEDPEESEDTDEVEEFVDDDDDDDGDWEEDDEGDAGEEEEDPSDALVEPESSEEKA